VSEEFYLKQAFANYDIDPTFSGTREYKLLEDLAASMDEGDVAKFTDAVKEFDSMTRLDPWKTTPSEGKERAKEKGGRRRG